MMCGSPCLPPILGDGFEFGEPYIFFFDRDLKTSPIKRYRSSKMRQRWLAAVLLHCEQQFKRVKGHASIDEVVAAIDAIHREDEMPEAA